MFGRDDSPYLRVPDSVDPGSIYRTTYSASIIVQPLLQSHKYGFLYATAHRTRTPVRS